MGNLTELSQKIARLSKDAKNQENHPNFKLIIELYENEIRNQFIKDEILNNELLIKNIFNAYKGIGKFEDGASFIITVVNYKITPNTDKYFVNSFGWNLFFLLKQYTKGDEETNIESSVLQMGHSNLKIEKNIFVEYLSDVLKILDVENTKDANLRVRLVFQFIKFEKTNNSPDWRVINELLNFLDPEKLDKTGQVISIKNGPKAGKQIELAPDIENWYSYKTKALLEIESYVECINASEKALQEITKFHYDNEVWLKRRIALSKLQLGETAEGIKLLEEVLLRKKEWFVFKEYAAELLKLNRIEEAFKHAIDAALVKGEILLRLDLFKILAEILRLKGENELADKHNLLELLFRIEKGWKIPDHLNEINEKYKDKIAEFTSKSVAEELKEYWRKFLKEGKVKKVMVDKRIGWIKGDSGEYFFRFSVYEGAIAKLVEGNKVKFSTSKSLNKMKNNIEDDIIYMIVG